MERVLVRCSNSLLQHVSDADLAHLVERHLAKVEVASSSLVIRSICIVLSLPL